MKLRENVPLAPRTTLAVGGAARYFVEASAPEVAREALAWAGERGVGVEVIGGGSNLLVADRGVDALVLRMRSRDIRRLDEATIDVDAGTNWDELVGWTVARGLAGLECLSGIPGDVGAAPIQNIGAYGQELSETLVEVEALERRTGELATLSRARCQLGYRDSVFKHAAAGRYLLTRVRLRLEPGGAPKIAYAELERALSDPAPSLRTVRDTVISLRRAKSMVLDPHDENRRSAGSFFVNPTVGHDEIDGVLARAAAVAPHEQMPSYPAAEGRIKLSAAWLIERAGLSRGTARGRVGISTKHSLGIVNRGGATAGELVAFALEVKTRVRETFGVTLHPEPRMLGFEPEELAALLA